MDEEPKSRLYEDALDENSLRPSTTMARSGWLSCLASIPNSPDSAIIFYGIEYEPSRMLA